MRRPFAFVVGLVACSSAPIVVSLEADSHSRDSSAPATVNGASADASAGSPTTSAGVEQYPEAEDPMDLHRATRDELLSLFSIRTMNEQEEKRILPNQFLRSAFGVDGPGRINQGNRALSYHAVGKQACLKGLEGVVIQTPEQRSTCGAENMVPVFSKGESPHFCVDVFEFPNKACELPMVWVPPTYAMKVCQLQGKRLCTQSEWSLSCRADPEGGPDTKYAYGDTLDLAICHTERPHRLPCISKTAQTAWESCTTDTEPSGAFPKCKSRFGVFDQHGNVAEIMTRKDAEDGQVKSQLKGSAWFYTELAKEPGVPLKPTDRIDAYPDHCRFDPRWHVEPIEKAWHVNYHLGFRCCKDVP